MGVVLAMGAVALLPGCHSVAGSRSEFDAASADLRHELDRIAWTDERRQRLASIAARLEDTARSLVDRHERFLSDFEFISIERAEPAERLRALTDRYLEERVASRAELVRLQRELRAELTDPEWSEVVTVLNRKARLAARPRRSREG